MAVETAVVDGAKRSAEEAVAGEPPAKTAKVEGDVKEEVKAEVKDEIKDELKSEIKTEGTPSKEKKEKKEHKEGKEKKEKKDKSEKHKDKKEKKEHKEGKENDIARKEKFPSASPEVDKELDQRKLFKDGQKFITPPVSDATRAFYESLIQENPDSKIAIRFVVEYGLFALDAHKAHYKRYTKLKEKGAFDTKVLMQLQLAKKEKKDEKKDKSEKKEKKEKSEKKAMEN